MTTTTPRPATKVRRSLTFTPDVADYLDAQPNASLVADEAVRVAMAAAQRREALGRLISDLESAHGEPEVERVAHARSRLA